MLFDGAIRPANGIVGNGVLIGSDIGLNCKVIGGVGEVSIINRIHDLNRRSIFAVGPDVSLILSVLADFI
jgi:hypothetical protein